VSSFPPPADPALSDGFPRGRADGSAADEPTGARPAGRGGRRRDGVPWAAAYWRGWPEIRADLRASAGLVLLLATAGLLAGLVWWWLAPRADFRITDAGPVAIGNPSEELFAADDAVFALVLAAFGLVAGVAAWFLRRRRGVAIVLALAIGCSAMAAIAWQLGELLGAGPTKAQLAVVGTVVTTSLMLRSIPALAIAPFAALLAYLVPVLAVQSDDLGRTPESPPAEDAVPPRAPDGPGSSDEADRSLVETPPLGRPSA
jgi:hypothetical protein